MAVAGVVGVAGFYAWFIDPPKRKWCLILTARLQMYGILGLINSLHMRLCDDAYSYCMWMHGYPHSSAVWTRGVLTVRTESHQLNRIHEQKARSNSLWIHKRFSRRGPFCTIQKVILSISLL
jgi:hypothetical protein